MAVPGYQDFMLPVLRLCEGTDGVGTSDLVPRIAEQFALTQADQDELLPSGSETRFRNRVQWACYYLFRAGLLERPARGKYRISNRGREVLADPPPKITDQFLRRFPEFDSFVRGDSIETAEAAPSNRVSDSGGMTTPSERLETAYQELRNALASDLLDRMRRVSPSFFEQLVVDVIVAMGYGGTRSETAASVTGKSGDGGIDGVIKEDKLGLDAIYLQAKRWIENVGRPTVQEFAGSLEGERANKGILITTSGFTSEAREYVRRIGKRIILIDGPQLAELMIDHGVGVTTERSYAVRRIDGDYFEE